MTSAIVSASSAIATSVWPAPTVSIRITSNEPESSSRRATLRVAPAIAPCEPRLARLRTKTSSRPSRCVSIRSRSPSTAPPLIGLDGSIASTATRAPAFA